MHNLKKEMHECREHNVRQMKSFGCCWTFQEEIKGNGGFKIQFIPRACSLHAHVIC